MRVPLEVTREDDLWMARSSLIKGLLVTGETLDELFDELPVIAQSLYEVSREKRWTFVQGAPKVRPNDIVWLVEFPQQLLHAA